MTKMSDFTAATSLKKDYEIILLDQSVADAQKNKRIKIELFSVQSHLIYVDDAAGNDTTGFPGSFLLPFKTITAAQTAAGSGSTIFVLPGAYSDTNLAKAGVHYEYIKGAVHTVGASQNCYYDVGVTINYTVGGRGEFYGGLSVMHVDGADSKVSFECFYAEATTRPVLINADATNAIVVFTSETDIYQSGGTGEDAINIYGASCQVSVTANRIIGDVGVIILSDSLTPDCNVTIRANEYIYNQNNEGYAGLLGGGSANVDLYGHWNMGGNGAYGNASIVVGGHGDPVNANITFHGNITGVGNTNGTISIGATGAGTPTVRFKGKIESNGFIVNDGGNVHFHAPTKYSTTGTVTSTIKCISGKVFLHDYVENSSNDPAGCGVLVMDDNLLVILQPARIYCTNGGAKSVTSAAPHTIITYTGAVANKDKSTNITELFGALDWGSLVVRE